MTSKEIRNSFLDFFKNKEHRIVESAPVVPYDDPTLLFTNAGMNQFKDVFLGKGKRDYKRAADTQKCIRVSGKHNDLEEVGVDTYHHTFFEMLGNWSFGDYYKEEAIEWAWELLTKVWKLDEKRLYATVFREDDEAYEIWKKYLPESRIQRFDEKDNFWEMGETGPCGPCSEIHYDKTPDYSGSKMVNAGSPDVIEIWNLVFIQYNRKQDGTLEELSSKHVDTGMGFERIVAVLQNKDSNYDTDVFQPVINKIADLSGKDYSSKLDNPDGTAMRVIADHLRTLSFAIADGAIPGNEGRGYVLRRILRRASRFARNLGFKEPVIYKLLPALISVLGDTFPELNKNKDVIERVIKAEEESFLNTLERGLLKFDEIAEANAGIISGKDAFLLYDTFGFPIDLTQLIARERGLEVDYSGFEEEMQKQKERSRASRKVHHQDVETPVINAKTEFTGYDELETEAKVLFIAQNQIVTDKTPFYVESGGQVSDTGTITIGAETYQVEETRKSGDAVIHFCDRNIENPKASTALLKVTTGKRRNIMRNHSATHLLHEALTQVLGSHIKQSGSLVAPDYLRFDFNHFEKVTDKQLKEIESIVNKIILDAVDVETRIMSIEEAKKNSKTKMFFGDKYGDIVRVVTMGNDFSSEFCGGTHVKNTSEIGLFKITSESSIAAGVRRIEAITGEAVMEYIYEQEHILSEKDKDISILNDKIRSLEKELDTQKNKQIGTQIDDIINAAIEINGIKIATKKIDVQNIDQLRTAGENLRNALKKSGIGLLASVINDKVQLVCVATDDIMKKMPAGKIVGQAAKIIGGGGGGKPHMATAGGRDASKINDMFSKMPEIISSFNG
jgi:alanyl-tRNA synthetase